jgi:predicted Ser/Thr protein kinase
MYPNNQDYKLALMIGADSFNTLDGIEVLPHPLYPTEPWFATGGLAIVFKVRYKGKFYALKCFTKEVAERQKRLNAISAYLNANPSPYFVDFSYLDNEIWVDNEEGGQGYPVVLMEWVEGLTLDNYLKEKCESKNKSALKELYDTFGHMVLWLQAQPIAHGDLKHDNIIILSNGQIKLIDYDGMYIPGFKGQISTELGSPCYQHPQRTAEYFNEHLDDFSLLILQTTLLAFETETSLFASSFNGDGLLFKDSDFLDFNAKLLKNTIWALPNILLPILATNIQKQLTSLQAFDFAPYFVHLQHSKLDRTWIENFALNHKHQFRFLISTKHSLSEKIIEKYQTYKSHKTYSWSWFGLEINSKIPWSVEFIEKYKDKLSWCGITSSLMGIYGLSLNPNLPWSEEFIEKYKDKWHWGEFGLSNNPNLPWSEEFVEKYKDKWSWKGLGGNKSLPWSINFIEKYENKWHFEDFGLSRNQGLPWSIDLIEKYEHKWDSTWLSSNRSLPWSIDLIEKFEHKWKWGSLSQNKNLPWSIYFLEKFDKKLLSSD